MKKVLRYAQDKILPHHHFASQNKRNGIILFLVGPTAVGKTKVSLHLAKLINAEIISCDSMQVYKGMDIGTQKPAPAQREAIPHHMIDIVSPSRNFSAAGFRRKAVDYVEKIHKKGKVPLFVGGTAFYMKALIDGLFPSPPADRKLRSELKRQEKQQGAGYLYKRLKRADARTARMLHPNDIFRIIRALEVYIQTKRPMSELKKKTKGLKDRYNIKIFCLNQNRQALYEAIDRRVDKIFKSGFLAECKRLKKKRLSMTASQALGYKEAFAYLDGKISLKEAKELMKKNTRHFAKRQLSWFRNDKRIDWIDMDKRKPKEAAELICLRCMK